MGKYSERGSAPTTLTDREQRLVLGATGAFSRSFRDHCLISLAMGTGLREHELVALERDDVIHDGQIRRRVPLLVFKGSHRLGRRRRQQWVVLPQECRRKLGMWVPKIPAGPLFPSRQGGRLSTRQVRELWKRWQVRAGFERHHPFHALRHTFVSNVYAACKDPFLAQQLARHASVETTQLYAHVGDERVDQVTRNLRC